MNDPVKCPDCGLWWRTDTHRCKLKNDFIYCSMCGKKVADARHHTCISLQTMLDKYNKPKKDKGNPHDKDHGTGGYS